MPAPSRKANRQLGCGSVCADRMLYQPLIVQLFAHYDLLGDGSVCRDAFASTQRLVGGLISQLTPSVATSQPLPLSIARSAIAAPHPASRRTVSPAGTAQLFLGGSTVVSNRPGALRPPSPGLSPLLGCAKQTLALDVGVASPIRSPSLTAYGARKTVGKGVSNINDFLEWQMSLLAASSKSRSEKRQRLTWLIRELDKAEMSSGRRQFWQKRHTVLQSFLSAVAAARASEEKGEFQTALGQLKPDSEQLHRIIAEEQQVGRREERLAVTTLDAHKQFLEGLKRKWRDEFVGQLQNKDMACSEFEGKLQAALGICAKEDLASEFELLEKMRNPFELQLLTIAGRAFHVMASRTDAVEHVKTAVASELGMMPYRVALVMDGLVLQDAAILENSGIIDGHVQLSVVISQRQWYHPSEMGREDFIQRLNDRGVHLDRWCLTRLRNGLGFSVSDERDELAFRRRYAEKLEFVDEKEKRERERKEMQKERRQRRQLEIEAEARAWTARGEAEAMPYLMQKVAELEICAATQGKVVSDIKADVTRVLDDEVIPHMARANHAITGLNLLDVVEARDLLNPPLGLRRAGEALCIMFGERPEWTIARKMIGTCLVERMTDYDKDDIDPVVLKEVERYLSSEDFVPERIQMASRAGAAIRTWIRSVYVYASTVPTLIAQKDSLLAASEKLEDLLLELDCWKSWTKDATSTPLAGESDH